MRTSFVSLVWELEEAPGKTLGSSLEFSLHVDACLFEERVEVLRHLHLLGELQSGPVVRGSSHFHRLLSVDEVPLHHVGRVPVVGRLRRLPVVPPRYGAKRQQDELRDEVCQCEPVEVHRCPFRFSASCKSCSIVFAPSFSLMKSSTSGEGRC